MENTAFPYDSKWEAVTFNAPTKPIVSFGDVNEYQQRPIHDEYLNFLADLQKVHNLLSRQFSPRKYQIHLILLNSIYSSHILRNFKPI